MVDTEIKQAIACPLRLELVCAYTGFAPAVMAGMSSVGSEQVVYAEESISHRNYGAGRRLQSARATFDVNLGGTMNIAEAMRRHVPRAQLIFVSSGEVYGASFLTARAPVDEHAAVDPMTFYAASKAAAELFIAQAGREGLGVIRLRPFNHIGPGPSDRFVVASFVAQIVNIGRHARTRFFASATLDAERDFLDVRDVAAAYVEAMTSEHLESGTILNIASGEAHRVGDILESLLKKAKVALRTVADPARFPPSTYQLRWGMRGWRAACLVGRRKSPSSRPWPTCSMPGERNP